MFSFIEHNKEKEVKRLLQEWKVQKYSSSYLAKIPESRILDERIKIKNKLDNDTLYNQIILQIYYLCKFKFLFYLW